VKKCPARFPVHLTGAGWSPEPIPGSKPDWLTCILEEGHEGPHCSPAPSSPLASHLAWEFKPYHLGELGDHPNCKCELPRIDSSMRLPLWFIHEALEEAFGQTSPRIFFPDSSAQIPTGPWKPPF